MSCSFTASEGPTWRDHHAQLDDLIASLHARAWLAAGGSPSAPKAPKAESSRVSGPVVPVPEPMTPPRHSRQRIVPGSWKRHSPEISVGDVHSSKLATPRSTETPRLTSPDVRPILLGGRRPEKGVSLREVTNTTCEADAGLMPSWTPRLDEEWDLVQTAVSITESLNLLQDWSVSQLASPREAREMTRPMAQEAAFLARLRELHQEQRAQLEGLREGAGDAGDALRPREERGRSRPDVCLLRSPRGAERTLLRPAAVKAASAAETAGGGRQVETAMSDSSTLWQSFRDALGVGRRKAVSVLSAAWSTWKASTFDAGLRRVSADAHRSHLRGSFDAWRSWHRRNLPVGDELPRILSRRCTAASLQGLRTAFLAWRRKAQFRWRAVHSMEVARAFHSWRFYAMGFRRPVSGEVRELVRAAESVERPEGLAAQLALAASFLAWTYAAGAGGAIPDLHRLIRHRREMRQKMVH